MSPVPDWASQGAHPYRTLLAHGLTRRDLASGLWMSPFSGVRQWSAAGRDDAGAVVAAAAALMPTGCALGGWASAFDQGIHYLDGNVGYAGQLDVPLIATEGHQLRKRPGIRPIRTLVPAHDITVVDGVAAVRLDLAGAQQMCLARNLVEAVVAADMVTSVRTGEPTLAMHKLAHRVLSIKKTRGIVQARTALDLASDRSASPEESRTRMVWVLDAGLPQPSVNPPIFDLHGRLLGYGDLVDAEAGYVHEVDGGQHREIGQHTDDNVREELFEDHGLVVSRSTRRDRADPWALSRRMRSTYRRGLARDRSQDRWTLTPPPGWTEPPVRRHPSP